METESCGCMSDSSVCLPRRPPRSERLWPRKLLSRLLGISLSLYLPASNAPFLIVRVFFCFLRSSTTTRRDPAGVFSGPFLWAYFGSLRLFIFVQSNMQTVLQGGMLATLWRTSTRRVLVRPSPPLCIPLNYATQQHRRGIQLPPALHIRYATKRWTSSGWR